MQFKFQIGTKILFGRNCIKENKAEFPKYGKRALIVTGKSSGKASGALDVCMDVLKEQGIDYLVYDRVGNNPSLENVKDGGRTASSFNAEFIIGIGGGSPLDAAKAIAVLAVNDIEPLELYKNVFAEKPLPVLAIPTTAGTGSEVTPYSILTRIDMQTKMSFGNEDTFPKIAFIDAQYTESLPYQVAVDTAVDAMSHAVEGYLSKRSTPVSDIFAVEAVDMFGKCIQSLLENNIDYDTREKLLYMSTLGGMVIAHTGTTIVHGMGYSLTYFKGIPHGRANGLLMKEYFKFNYGLSKYKIDNIMKFLNIKDIDGFGAVMDSLLHTDEKFTEQELKLFASIAMKQRSTSYNIRSVKEEDLVYIMKMSLNGGFQS